MILLFRAPCIDGILDMAQLCYIHKFYPQRTEFEKNAGKKEIVNVSSRNAILNVGNYLKSMKMPYGPPYEMPESLKLLNLLKHILHLSPTLGGGVKLTCMCD